MPVSTEENRFTLATGTQSALGDTGADVDISGMDFLRHVTVSSGGGSPPIRAEITVRWGGSPWSSLKGGWVRSPSNHPGSHALNWHGDLPVRDQPNRSRIFIAARNDTGVSVTIIWSHNGISEEKEEEVVA